MRPPFPAPASPTNAARTADVADEAPPAPARADSAAEAQGRRTLSTAFVRIGPDGRLTVERHDGRVLVLRDVVMRARDYCGIDAGGGSAKTRYCGGYAEIASARPGGNPARER